MHNTSQSQDTTDLDPFSPGDEERFRTNALVALVAFGSLRFSQRNDLCGAG
ncbi:hypothetical protein [Nocardiopsis metallicus]|uniref:Uncharacterized protein n=1 Tax=Nocardiopsis metallicus TaxID=179819 RepID=A0A840WCP4_9ACTN|nr:hypothetical protein [Nocardiopsis metallicus]MBB5489775.1 hypothetical protein [Nocardiopsis metallicus]